jgi:hypothetical protein
MGPHREDLMPYKMAITQEYCEIEETSYKWDELKRFNSFQDFEKWFTEEYFDILL